MLICAFSPHYQLIYINFDISSFSVISYLLTTNIQHKNIGIATQWYFSLAVYINRRDSGKKFIGRCTGGGYVWAYIENSALRIDRQLAFLPGDDHFQKQLGVLCKFYFSKIYLNIFFLSTKVNGSAHLLTTNISYNTTILITRLFIWYRAKHAENSRRTIRMGYMNENDLSFW